MDCSLFFLLAVWACTERFISQATAEQTESCPDSVLGNERRSSCPKRCQTDKDCPGRRRCLFDGQCGLSCVIPGRTCPWPLPLNPNTISLLLSPAPSFSSTLETRCQPGFAMAGGMEAVVRRCQGDRRWSGEDPTCTAVPAIRPRYCPLPDEIRNEFTIKGSSAVGSNILYSCHPGFKLVGNRENFCQQNQTWQYPHPICQRVFCPPPAEVDHGYLVAVQRQEYEVGEDIYYLCKKTFLLDGLNRVNCQSNGTWSEVPFCRARCTVPAQRSRVTLGGLKLWPYEIPEGTVQHGENVTFYCKHPEKQCSFTAVQSCFDGELPAPDCYLVDYIVYLGNHRGIQKMYYSRELEPTWLQYKIFPHRLVSEIELCNSSD